MLKDHVFCSFVFTHAPVFISDPSFTLVTTDCKKNEGYYKCHIFVQFAGSPASEQIESEVLLKSPDCKS